MTSSNSKNTSEANKTNKTLGEATDQVSHDDGVVHERVPTHAQGELQPSGRLARRQVKAVALQQKVLQLVLCSHRAAHLEKKKRGLPRRRNKRGVGCEKETEKPGTSWRWMLSKSWGLRTACTIQLSGVIMMRVRRGDSGRSRKRARGPGDTVSLPKKLTSDSKTKR